MSSYTDDEITEALLWAADDQDAEALGWTSGISAYQNEAEGERCNARSRALRWLAAEYPRLKADAERWRFMKEVYGAGADTDAAIDEARTK